MTFEQHVEVKYCGRVVESAPVNHNASVEEEVELLSRNFLLLLQDAKAKLYEAES